MSELLALRLRLVPRFWLLLVNSEITVCSDAVCMEREEGASTGWHGIRWRAFVHKCSLLMISAHQRHGWKIGVLGRGGHQLLKAVP